MKVVANNNSHLIVEDQPWLLGLLLIGMFLAFLAGGIFQFMEGQVGGSVALIGLGCGLSLLLLVTVVRRTRFTFDRENGQLTQTVRTIAGLTETTVALDRVTRAFVEESVDSDGTTYRVCLSLSGPDQTILISTSYSSGRRSHAQMADRINAWIGAKV